MLVFSYAAKLDDEWQATLRHWQPATFGFGADVLLLGATWDQVATRPTPGGGDKTRTPPQLEWDFRRTDSWRQVLGMCAARLKAQPGRPGRCVLRSVAEQLRQPWAEPYRSLLRSLAPLAHEAGVPLIEQFEGTWAGAAAGLLQHHDSTRIHFSDTGAPHPNRPRVRVSVRVRVSKG